MVSRKEPQKKGERGLGPCTNPPQQAAYGWERGLTSHTSLCFPVPCQSLNPVFPFPSPWGQRADRVTECPPFLSSPHPQHTQTLSHWLWRKKRKFSTGCKMKELDKVLSFALLSIWAGKGKAAFPVKLDVTWFPHSYLYLLHTVTFPGRSTSLNRRTREVSRRAPRHANRTGKYGQQPNSTMQLMVIFSFHLCFLRQDLTP